MTNDPRAQSEPPSLVEWLRIDADFQEHQLEHNIPMVPAAEDAPRLRAAADALEAQAAEIARLKSETHRALDRAYNSAREHEVLVQNNAALLTQLAATRAERDALAALVREAAPELKIMYPLHFEKWLARADEALRAPQTGGAE